MIIRKSLDSKKKKKEYITRTYNVEPLRILSRLIKVMGFFSIKIQPEIILN